MNPIRYAKCHVDDRADIADFWLRSTVVSQSFIPSPFWEQLYSRVKNDFLSQAHTIIARKDNSIVGFISLLGNELGGLFVEKAHQRMGIGSNLLALA